MDKKFHVSKAERNEQFYKKHELEESEFNEWAITVLFYVCVHYVDAVLCGDLGLNVYQKHPKDYFTRTHAVAGCSKLKAIETHYLNLLQRSRDARYGRLSFPQAYLSQLVTDDYEPTRKHIRTCLGLS